MKFHRFTTQRILPARISPHMHVQLDAINLTTALLNIRFKFVYGQQIMSAQRLIVLTSRYSKEHVIINVVFFRKVHYCWSSLHAV